MELQERADLLVISGITGDLAKVTTFHSVYGPAAARIILVKRLEE